MELNEDLVMNIICRLHMDLKVRCKILSKSFNNRICELILPDQSYAQRWLQQQGISKLLFYSLPSPLSYGMLTQYRESIIFHKISINSRQEISTTKPLNNVSVLASCNGLLLIQFHQVMGFCVFNPITGTGLYRLIPYPEPKIYSYFKMISGGAGLVVDYPTSNRYKLVTIEKLDEHEGYKFHMYSSEEPGVWHEFQFRTNLYYDVFSVSTRSAFLVGQPVYVHDCLHWLRNDGCILAFDTTSGYGRIINKHLENYGNACLGAARGVLNLVCAFEEFIVIYAYDYTSGNWTVSHTLANFNTGVGGLDHAFPKWFNGEKLLFLVRSSYVHVPGCLYEYDFEINMYKKVANLYIAASTCFFSFEPTLANIPKTLPSTVHSEYLPVVTTTLNELRHLIANKPRVAPEKAVK